MYWTYSHQSKLRRANRKLDLDRGLQKEKLRRTAELHKAMLHCPPKTPNISNTDIKNTIELSEWHEMATHL